MTTLEITDHALLRWMERVHGIDVKAWRALMRSELDASLEAYDGRGDPSAAGFVVCGQTVVTVVSPGCRTSRKPGKASLRLPRVA